MCVCGYMYVCVCHPEMTLQQTFTLLIENLIRGMMHTVKENWLEIFALSYDSLFIFHFLSYFVIHMPKKPCFE